MRVQAAIVGGGPAGLSAATEIARRGADIVLFDENSAQGGRLLGQLHEERRGHWWKGWEVAARLVQEALATGVVLRSDTSVWGAELTGRLPPTWRLRVADLRGSDHLPSTYEAEFVLIATGAHEKPVAAPGWTLPGVMTVGAAQVLTNVHRVRPGRRVLVAGIDPLALTVARQLKLAGVEVVGVVLPPPLSLNGSAGSVRSTLEGLANMASSAPTPWLRLAATALRNRIGVEVAARVSIPGGVRVWGVPVHHRVALLEVLGAERVEAAVIAPLDASGEPISRRKRKVEVDAVCLSGGLAPLADLPAALGCEFVTEERLGGDLPLHSRDLETSRPGLFVAGNATGVEGAEVAIAQGKLAGLVISRRLGHGPSQAEVENARRELDRARQDAKIEFYPGTQQARSSLEERWRGALTGAFQ